VLDQRRGGTAAMATKTVTRRGNRRNLPVCGAARHFLLAATFWGESLLPNDLIYELDPVCRAMRRRFCAPGNRLLSDVVYFFYPWRPRCSGLSQIIGCRCGRLIS